VAGSLSLNFGSTALLILFKNLKTDFFITLYFSRTVKYYQKQCKAYDSVNSSGLQQTENVFYLNNDAK
jgi:hypothetical protein